MVVSTSWLAKNLDDQQPPIIVHVARTPQMYAQGHIPGAQFVAWDELTVTRDGLPVEMPAAADLMKLLSRLGVDRSRRIVIYDEEQGVMAARAYVTMDYLGLGKRVSLLDGEFVKWRREGRPLVAGAPATQPATAPVAPDTGLVAAYVPIPSQVLIGLDEVRDLVWLRGNMPGSEVCIIDARPDYEYSGQKPGDGITRGGHIPGAVNVPWSANLQDDMPILRSPEVLRRLYADAGAVKGRTVVAYCRIGGQASVTYFILKYLGYDARLYDGSYSQWSTAKDAPIKAGDKP